MVTAGRCGHREEHRVQHVPGPGGARHRRGRHGEEDRGAREVGVESDQVGHDSGLFNAQSTIQNV